MPTKRIFQMALIVAVGVQLGSKLATQWGARTLAEGRSDWRRPLAEFAVML